MDKYDIAGGLIGGLQQGLGTYLQTSEAAKERQEREKQRLRAEALQLAQLRAQGYDVSGDGSELNISPSERMLQENKQKGLLEARKSGLIPVYDDQGLITDYKPDLEMLRAKSPQFGMPQLTPGQKAADTAFGKEYSDYIAGGGKADIEKNIQQLKDVRQELGKTDTATGPLIGLLPKSVRDLVTPKGAALQDKVEEVVQRNLRAILGAQFTEKEGERLIARAYNPRLSEAENMKRLNALITQIESAAQQKDLAAKFFEEKGTLQGFLGLGSFQDARQGLMSPQGAEARQLSPQDQQALDWANANPQDPRSQAIKQRLGQ